MGSVSYGLGADLSLPLPVGDDGYLNLSSQKRPTGRNLGEIVWYDALAPRPEVLLPWCLVCACARSPNSSSYHICGQAYRHLLVPVSLTCDRISHLFG